MGLVHGLLFKNLLSDIYGSRVASVVVLPLSWAYHSREFRAATLSTPPLTGRSHNPGTSQWQDSFDSCRWSHELWIGERYGPAIGVRPGL